MLSLRFGPNFPNILHIFVFMFGLLVYIFLSFISAFCFSFFFFFFHFGSEKLVDIKLPLLWHLKPVIFEFPSF